MPEMPVTQQNMLVPDTGSIDRFTVGDIIIGGGLTTYFEAKDDRGQRCAINVPTRDALANPSNKLRDRFLQVKRFVPLDIPRIKQHFDGAVIEGDSVRWQASSAVFHHK